MKQNLQRTSEWIELFLNYAVVFGIEIALNALIGDRVPVRVWLAAALYPVCFYLFRKKLKHFWVFFLLHPGSRCVCNADGKELAGRCSCDCGAWCILWSAFHPPSSASGDTGTGVPAACSGSGGDRSIFGLQL